MDRIHSQRCQHGENRLLKVSRVVLLFFARQFVKAKKKDVVLFQSRNQLLDPCTVLVIDDSAHPGRNRSELFSGTHSVGPGRTEGALALLLQTSDPDLEEFIEI